MHDNGPDQAEVETVHTHAEWKISDWWRQWCWEWLKIGLMEDRQEDGLTIQTGADVRCQKLCDW